MKNKLSQAQIKALIKEAVQPEHTINYKIGEEIIEINVLRSIDATTQTQFINLVLGLVFQNNPNELYDQSGEVCVTDTIVDSSQIFLPANKQLAINIGMLHYFADIPIKTNADYINIISLAGNHKLVCEIKSAVNSNCLESLTLAIDDAISFKQKQLCAFAQHELAKICAISQDTINFATSDSFKTLTAQFDTQK